MIPEEMLEGGRERPASGRAQPGRRFPEVKEEVPRSSH